MSNKEKRKKTSNWSTTAVLAADGVLASGAAIFAWVFFKLRLEYLVMFLVITLGLAIAVTVLLRYES
jgi:hypothetical protein